MAKTDVGEVDVLLEKVKDIFCLHPEHTINVTKIYVPPGRLFVHACPGCGHETKITGPNPSYRN